MGDITDRSALHATAERSFDLIDFDFRDGATAEDRITFEGVASVVDAPYTVRDMFGEFTETIARGAFNKTLKDGGDVALFVNHQSKAIPLATRSDGSLSLRATPDLAVTASLNPRRHDVQDVREAVRDGQLRQMSIGMVVPKGKDSWNADYTERTIHELRLIETSIVWQGANHLTTAGVRAAEELFALTADDFEPAELERAIEFLTSLRTTEEITEPAPTFSTVAALAQMWDRRQVA